VISRSIVLGCGGLAAVAAAVLLVSATARRDVGEDRPAAAPAATAPDAPARGPNVLFVTLDTTRADHLGCYGSERVVTPALDGLAARGAVFEQAFTSCPLTLPAHATIFTGLEPPEHGVRVNGKHKLGAAPRTMAEILAARGYRTAAFVAAFVLDRKFGLGRGFETFDDDLAGAQSQEVPEPLSVYRPGNRVVDAAVEWLEEATQPVSGDARPQPFFCWVHLYDAHYPYHPHPELADVGLGGEKSYAAELAFVDRQVGRLLGFLEGRGLAAETLIVAVADHGEGLEDHGEVEHGYLLNEEVLRVPLIMAWPGRIPEGMRVAPVVSLADLLPTVLELAGIPSPVNTRGRSLVPALRGEEMDSIPSYAETDLPFTAFGWSPLRSVTTAEWRYVRTPRPELYQRGSDPAELLNLASARPRQLQALEETLAGLEGAMTHTVAEEAPLGAEERERLASLGYVVAGGASPPADGARPKGPAPTSRGGPREMRLRDMKDMLPTKRLATRLRRGTALGTMDDEEVLELTRRLVQESPETASFRQQLGAALLAAGHASEAALHLSEAARLEPASAEAHHNLADALLRLGKRDEARAELAAALALDPDFVPAHVAMGNLLADDGLLDVAAGHFAEAVRLRPDHAGAHYNLANTLARRGRPLVAMRHYRAALAHSPDFAAAHYNLANLLRERGEAAAAVTHYERALRLDPGSVDAHNNLGVALAALGRSEEAKARYLDALRIDPDFANAHVNLSNWYGERGEHAAALEHDREVVRLRPEDPEPARRLAWALATCPDAGLRDGARALALAERAVALTERRDPRALDAQAAAYAALGRFDEAVATASEALRLAQRKRRTHLAAEIERRIGMYATAKPFDPRPAAGEPSS
jgi:arylsulfatase A-like enzyme/tetratricopeptide (TPR) repeat protein